MSRSYISSPSSASMACGGTALLFTFTLRVWERKILRKVYGTKKDTNGWRIRTNKELQDQNRSADIVTSIKVRRWAERMVKRVFLGNPGGIKKPGRPGLRWLDCVEDGLKTLGVRRWRKMAEGREE
jgi:hypothetical protein